MQQTTEMSHPITDWIARLGRTAHLDHLIQCHSALKCTVYYIVKMTSGIGSRARRLAPVILFERSEHISGENRLNLLAVERISKMMGRPWIYRRVRRSSKNKFHFAPGGYEPRQKLYLIGSGFGFESTEHDKSASNLRKSNVPSSNKGVQIPLFCHRLQ